MTDQQLCFLSFRHRVIFIETRVSLFGGLAHKKPCRGEGKKGKRKGCRRRACVTTGRFSCDEILMALTLILQWVLLIQICRGRGDTLPPLYSSSGVSPVFLLSKNAIHPLLPLIKCVDFEEELIEINAVCIQAGPIL